MNTRLYWILVPWAGQLAISARPQGGDWLEDEVVAWDKAGLDIVVSALTQEEIEELDLSKEEALCLTHGIEFISFPIEDRAVPHSFKSMRDLAQNLRGALKVGKTIGIHCRQGIGRSSLLAACILVQGRYDTNEVFEWIRQARGCTVPDTLGQREWVSLFAKKESEEVGKGS